jgi:hypothetical protein
LFRVFSAEDIFAIIEQIKQFATVDFVERNPKLEIGILIEQINHIVRRQQVQARDLTVRCSHHRPRFATPCLAVRKARRFVAFKSLSDKRKDALIVNVLVRGIAVERIIETEIVFLNILRQVDF